MARPLDVGVSQINDLVTWTLDKHLAQRLPGQDKNKKTKNIYMTDSDTDSMQSQSNMFAGATQTGGPPGLVSAQMLNAFKDYNGQKAPDTWLQTFNMIANLFSLPDELRYKVAITKLTDEAQRWSHNRCFRNWDDFQAQLSNRFGESPGTAIARLEACRQGENEPPRAFADRFLHDAEKAGRQEDDALVFTFMQRLNPDLRQEVLRHQPKTIEDAVEYANWWLGAQVGTYANNNYNGAGGGYSSTNSHYHYNNYNNGGAGGYYRATRAPNNNNNFNNSSGGYGNNRSPFNRPLARNNAPLRPPRPFQEMTNRPRVAAPPPKPAAAANAIDDLVRGMAGLQLNLQQQNDAKAKQLEAAQRQIRTLQFALDARAPQINFLGEEQDEEEGEDNYSLRDHMLAAAELDLDPDSLAEIMAKRPAEGDVISRQIPVKRTAIDPASNPYVPTRPTYLQRAGHTPAVNPTPAGARPVAARMPRNRIPLAPMAAAPANGNLATPAAAAAGNNRPQAPRAATTGNTTTRAPANAPAAVLANEKAKKITADICRSIKMDGQVEDTLPLKAVLLIVAGRLAGSSKLIKLGEEMAVQADNLMRRMAQSFKLSEGAALFSMAALAKPPRAHVSELLSRSQPAARTATATARLPTPLRIVGCLNGRELEMVVDTGATTSAVGLDCLRRCDLTHKIRDKASNYLTAEGTVAAGKGKAPNLVLGIGDFETRINPTVTNAINYNMLIGVDVLRQGKAVIDFGNNTMQLQVDPNNYVEVPFTTDPEAEDAFFSKEDTPASASGWNASSSTPSPEPAAPAAVATDAAAARFAATSAFAATAHASLAAATCGSSVQEQQQETTDVWDDGDDTDGNFSESYTLGDDTWSQDNTATIAPTDSKPAALSALKSIYPDLSATTLEMLATLTPLTNNDGYNKMEEWKQHNLLADAGDAPPQLLVFEGETPPHNTPCDLQELAQASTQPGRLVTTGYPGLHKVEKTATLATASLVTHYLSRPFDPTRDWGVVMLLQNLSDAHGLLPQFNKWMQPYHTWLATLTTLDDGSSCCHTNKPPQEDFDPMDIPSDDWEVWPAGYDQPLRETDYTPVRQLQQLYHMAADATEEEEEDTSDEPPPSLQDEEEYMFADNTGLSAIGSVSMPAPRNRPRLLPGDPNAPLLEAHYQLQDATDEDAMTSLNMVWPSLTNPDGATQMKDTALGDFLRQQLRATYFSTPNTWAHGLTTHICRLSMELGILPEYFAWVRSSPLPASPANNTNTPPTEVLLFFDEIEEEETEEEPPELQTDSEVYTTDSEDELPPLSDNYDDQDDFYYHHYNYDDLSDDMTPHDTTESEDEPPDLLDTESSSDDEEPCPPGPPPPHDRAGTPTQLLGALDVTDSPPQTPRVTHLPARALPEDEACAFPDDGVLDDNTQASLSALVDKLNLSEDEGETVVSLLEANKDVFCMHPNQLGTCKLGSLSIDTGDSQPIKSSYYKLPYAKQEQLKQHINNWRELGIIRPSNSPWASPMHLVPKKGGETRAVIDYRKLNNVTRKDAYPLPRIDDIIYNVGPACYFSTVDLFSGYFQVAMAGVDTPDAHNSVAKTAFCCPWGLFEFTKVPFGLTAAPAAFMRIMNEVLQDYIGNFVYVFLDDILIYSPTFEEHMRHLSLVFAALRRADLRLSPTKCKFATSHCSFLGFTLSEWGMGCDPRLTEAISLRPEPCMARNPKKAVMSFLGLCSFYRRFVKDFAEIAEPLTRLTGKNQPFVWGQEQQEAFDTLKSKLTSFPILQRPDFKRPFIVHTDASTKAVGAVLTQKDDAGREYAVAYHSAKLTATQTNWAATHLECWAVISAVCNAWPDFLLGREFTVVTDHTALKWLMTCPHLTGKLARWSLRLQEFLPFAITYRKGAKHLAPDALSRDPRHDDGFPFNTDPKTPGPETPEEQDLLLTMEETAPAAQDDARQPTAPDRTLGLFKLQDTSSTDPPPYIRISIEGNIGCGKTTVLEQLQALQQEEDSWWNNWHIIKEPVGTWHSFLGPFYETEPNTMAKHTAAVVLQQAVLNAYAARVPNPVAAPWVITDRSPWSSLAVFLPVQNLPPNLEQVVYCAAHHMHKSLDNALPTAVIYLKADPETCLERVQQRQRSGESAVTLEYLQQLSEQYDTEFEEFPGPTVTINANNSKEAVLSAVKTAVQILSAFSRPPPCPPESREPRPLAAAPFVVQEFPALQRATPGQLMTTLDPFLLRLFPEQLLIHEDSGLDTHPQGTPEEWSDDEDSQLELLSMDYIPTPLNMLYDAHTEVPVLYQGGPGKFAYSPFFCAEYQQRFGKPVDPQHRVDNLQALQLYAGLGPWLSNAAGSNIMVAVAPKKAMQALRVFRVHDNGTEVVYVDSERYAAQKMAQLGLQDNTEPAYPWRDGFRNEGYVLDSWVRQVRIRPLVANGVALYNAPTSTLQHGEVTPLPNECTDQPVEEKAVRLVSTLPPTDSGTDGTDNANYDQINMLDRPPKRKSAAHAVKRMHKWTTTQRQAITEDSDVPSDLPCEMCNSPYDWKNMLLCDVCQGGYHTYCVGLSSVPVEPYTCYYCLHPPTGPPAISSDSRPDDSEHPPAPDANQASEEGREDTAVPTAEAGAAPDDNATAHASDCDTSEEDASSDSSSTEGGNTDADEDGVMPTAILEIWHDAGTMQYLQTQQFEVEALPDNGSGKEMRRIEKRAAGYYWDAANQKLYKRPCDKHRQPREVPPPDTREALIDQLHQETGHLSTTKLCSVILQRYYWRGVYEQVAARVKQCDDCTRHKVLFKLKPELQPIPPSKIWERVHLDSMGPYPPSRHGNRYVCVGIDAMSKYVECWAVPVINSDTMCRFFMQHICANHGLPSTVVTDNGKEFQNTFPELMDQLGIKLLHSGAYNPQANGQVEAAVKNILHGLQKAVGDNATAWDDKMALVLLGQRCAVHSTTGYSPFFLNTGRNPVLPAERRSNQAAAAAVATGETTPPPQAPPVKPPRDPRLRGPRRDPTAAGPSTAPPLTLPAAHKAQDRKEENNGKVDVGGLVDPGTQLLLQQREAQRATDYAQVESNILRSQAKQKVDYSKRLHGPDPQEELPPGSLVLMWMPSKTKMHRTSAIEGPYRVVEHTSGSQVTIEDASGVKWSVAVSRLAPYRR